MCQESPCHLQWLGGHWGFLTGDMEDMGQYWPHNCSWHLIPGMSANCLYSYMIISVSRTTLLSSVTWRTLRVPDQRHEGHGSFLTINFFLDIEFTTCVPNFSILALLEVCQELPCHPQWLGGHWGFLTRDMVDIGLHNCSWHWNSDLCAKFQHSSMIRSVSRTTM